MSMSMNKRLEVYSVIEKVACDSNANTVVYS